MTLNILENVITIFTCSYLHSKNVSKETIFERSIAEKIRLRKEKLDEFGRKEHNIKINCLKKALLIIEVQVICTKN